MFKSSTPSRNSDYVVLNAMHGKQMVLAFIEVIHLDDHFRRRHMSGREANLVVDRNIEAFARIMSAKYERGEYRPYSRFGSTLPRVDITLHDIDASGEKLTDERPRSEGPMGFSPRQGPKSLNHVRNG